MDRDIILNKTDIIERCLARIFEEYDNNPLNLENYTKQDSIILNLQRACEACIDIAMHMISKNKWGIPQNSRDAFEILHRNDIISSQLLRNLKGMIGFRNIAVHNYQSLEIDILRKVIENNLKDLTDFTKTIIGYIQN